MRYENFSYHWITGFINKEYKDSRKNFTDRQKIMIKEHILGKKPLCKIAKRLGISWTMAWKVRKRTMSKLKKRFEEENIVKKKKELTKDTVYETYDYETILGSDSLQ